MDEKFKGIIYRHSLINNKGQFCRYTGQTLEDTVEDRIKKGYKNCIIFYNHINKYKWDNISTEVLKEGYYTQEELDNYEKFYIKEDKEDPDIFSLNLQEGGSNGKLAEESKQKISKTRNERIVSGEISFESLSKYMKENNPSKRPEVRAKMSENHANVSGKNHPKFNHDYVDDIVKAKNVYRWANIPFTKKDIGELLGMTKSQILHINRELAVRGLTWEEL
jgi:hypothetical protein